MPSFSQTQKVLDTETWEELRFLDENTVAHQLVAQKLREIVSRLYTDIPDGNLDDLDFYVFDDSQANAFFMPKEQNGKEITKNGKNIIAVSKGLLDICENEDELAGVVAHEFNHYRWAQTIGGANTVYQEQGADVAAVKLLMSAGYNPAYWVDISNKIFGGSTKDVLQSIGVHGSSAVRVENIKNAIAYERNQVAEFNTVDTKDAFINFKSKFDEAYKTDFYKSYLDQLLHAKFGTYDAAQMPIVEMIEVIGKEIPLEMQYPVRMAQVPSLLNKADKSQLQEKYSVDAPAPFIQKFAEDFMAHCLSMAKINNEFDISGKFDYERKNGRIANSAYRTLETLSNDIYPGKSRTLKTFGKISEAHEALAKFIEANKVEDMIASADEFNKTGYENSFAAIFSFPRFMMPTEDEAVGQKLPDYWHIDYADEYKYKGLNVKPIAELWRRVSKDLKQYPDNNYYDHAVDEDNNEVIIATGKEAGRINFERWGNNREKERRRQEAHVHTRFENELAQLNALANFSKGEITAQEFGDIRAGLSHLKSNEYIMDVSYNHVERNKYEKGDLETLLASEAFETFGKDSHPLQNVIENYQEPNSNTSKEYRALNQLLDERENEHFIRTVIPAQIKLYEEINPSLISEFIINASNDLNRSFYKIEKDSPQYILDMKKSLHKTKDEINHFLRLKFIEKVSRYQLDGTLKSQTLGIAKLTHDAIKAGEPTPYFDAILKKREITRPTNSQELNSIVHKYTGELDKHEHDVSHEMLAILLWEYCKNDYEPMDLKEIVSHLDTKNFAFSLIGIDRTIINDMADHISKNKLFEKNDFEENLLLYRKMEKLNAFSQDRCNQKELLDVLLADIRQMPKDLQEKHAFTLLSGFYGDEKLNSQDNYLKFSEHKNGLVGIYTDAIKSRLGIDDGSQEYTAEIKKVTDLLNSEIQKPYNKSYKIINNTDKNKIIRTLSDKIVSKEKTSYLMRDASKPQFDAEDFTKNDMRMRGMQVLLTAMEHNPELCKQTIGFLNTRYSQESAEDYRESVITSKHNISDVNDYISNEALEIMHKTFWNEDLSVRSVIMNRILNRYSSDIEKQADLVCDLHFAKDDPYRRDGELILKTVIKNFPNSEDGEKDERQALVLAALASANENKDDSHQNASQSVGKGLVMFFENMGPAWVKFGQLLSYVPDLPSEIRQDLATLKDKADMPSRWDVYETISKTLPNQLQQNIDEVQNVLGAGSFWVTTAIDYKNPQTDVMEKKVLSFLRPNADSKAKDGFRIIANTVANLAKNDKKFAPMKKVVEQARSSATIETDVVEGNKQFEKAKQIYGGTTINVGGNEFALDVADWNYYGKGMNNISYKMMDMAEGYTITSNKHQTEDKKAMAIAYTTAELLNLLRGGVWDIDRHSGQQNFEKVSNDNGFKKFMIKIFDTGAQIKNEPSTRDKVLLGEMLYGMVRATRTGKPIEQYMFSKIKKLDKLNHIGISTGYIADVQKGLMALSDIMEYQKEQKDKDGNVIVERKTLDGEDLNKIADAIIKSGLIDDKIKKTVATKAVLNKLRPLRKGWWASLSEGFKKTENNDIQIIAEPYNMKPNSKELNKPQVEINAIKRAEAEGMTLGISNKYVKQSSAVKMATAAVVNRI